MRNEKSAATVPQTARWRPVGKNAITSATAVTDVATACPEGNEELVAFGMKPDDFSPTAFQGIHAPFVLVLFDEACGIATPLWTAGESLVVNDESRMVAIGNPDDPTVEFAEICKPGSGWHVMEIGTFDSPNFTGESVPKRVAKQLIGRIYVEEKRRKWAPRSS